MVDYVLEVIAKFTNQIGIIKPGNPLDILEVLNRCDCICVGKPGKGAILGIVSPHPFNPKEVFIATELFYYVEPEYRATKFSVGLVKEFEEVARAKGATHVFMMAIEHSNDMAIRLYPKLGYSKLETTFIKEL